MVIMTGNAGIACIAMFTPGWFGEETCPTLIMRNKQNMVIWKRIDVCNVILGCYYSRVRFRDDV